MMDNKPDAQKLYDKGFKYFIEWSTDKSSKISSDFNLGPEFGEELRKLAQTPMGVAILKNAYAAGWKANKPIRDWQDEMITHIIKRKKGKR